MATGRRWPLAAALAGILLFSLAGCWKRAAPVPEPKPEAGAGPGYPVTSVAIGSSETPRPLVNWAQQQTGAEPVLRQHLQGERAYLAIVGVAQRSGGYTIRIERIVPEGADWLIDARLISPAPGAAVTLAITRPVGYFWLSRPLEGSLRLQLDMADPGQPPATSPPVHLPPPTADLVIVLEWADAQTLSISGMATVASLALTLESGSRVFGHTTVTPTNGRIAASVPVPRGVSKDLRLLARDPGSGEILGQVPVDRSLSPGTLYSANFRLERPVMAPGDVLRLAGKARVFEASFLVEVRSPSGSLLAREVITANDGAPNFGRFDAAIEVLGGVPAGSEVRLVTISAQDGSERVELAAPIH